ncbi:MAG: ABC transporter substrate-binding protein [Gammaproteobacteria bacterium]|nr:ABC transporter substrate-binding protein [Gammaproteobacteria bacterium]NBT44358.1 ABC transporter substrate-binding protein [Gammaproteobacteria bacterium]NBY23502.1 ABC transporter substrate-binding protein [Gammaproteobacteria bacterium]
MDDRLSPSSLKKPPKGEPHFPWWVPVALVLILSGPFLLEPKDHAALAHDDRRLVILSPHHESIRQEFGDAFASDWFQRTGERVYLDWRIPGGSSEIFLFLKSEFLGAFQEAFELQHGRSMTSEMLKGFQDPKTPEQPSEGFSKDVVDARRDFLASQVGIGVDLLFGGGTPDFQQLADAGYLVSSPPGGLSGIPAIEARHPEWFRSEVIPETLSGEVFRDPRRRWIGAVLATFGILHNKDLLKRLQVAEPPEHWEALGDPKLLGQLALADPSKSGSAAKAFELIIQEQIQKTLAAAKGPLGPEEEALLINEGWLKGLQLIQRMGANARYFTDSAAKIALEVGRGDAAAGMAIDSYGRATQDAVAKEDGSSRVGFVSPLGGTSVSVDPIALMRGSKDPELATAFMEFVLSMKGQKLWAFKVGTPEGPHHHALRRMPIRRDFYQVGLNAFMSDPSEEPYEKAAHFIYHPEWTRSLFGAIRFLIRVLCVDTHAEQQAAWRVIIAHGMPKEALLVFHDLSGVDLQSVHQKILPILNGRDKLAEVRLGRELAETFRARYRRAALIAQGAGS